MPTGFEKRDSFPVESRRGADTAERRLDRLRYLFDDSQLLAADSSPRGVLAFAAAFPVSNPVASVDRNVGATGCGDRALARPDVFIAPLHGVVLDSGSRTVRRGTRALQTLWKRLQPRATRRSAGSFTRSSPAASGDDRHSRPRAPSRLSRRISARCWPGASALASQSAGR